LRKKIGSLPTQKVSGSSFENKIKLQNERIIKIFVCKKSAFFIIQFLFEFKFFYMGPYANYFLEEFEMFLTSR